MKNTAIPMTANTQKHMAIRLGLSPSQFCQILQGRKRPSALKAVQLERFTGIGIRTWLFGSPTEIKRELEKVYGKINFKRGRLPKKAEVSK